jgi:streptomycin 3"-adenylyltransferase
MHCDWKTDQRIQSLPRGVRNGLAAYLYGLEDALIDSLVGIYAYGSLAWGCFNPDTSDIDTIVVLVRRVDADALLRLQQVHRHATIPIDATFATQDQLSIRYVPTEVEFLLKPMSDQIVRYPQGNWDFAVQSQDVYENGIRFCGPEITNLFQLVPWHCLQKSFERLFPYIVPRFKNPVLMLSRLAYTYTHRRMCSKIVAGNWALGAMPSQFVHLIDAEMRKYSGDPDTGLINNEDVLDYERYVRDYIAKLA